MCPLCPIHNRIGVNFGVNFGYQYINLGAISAPFRKFRRHFGSISARPERRTDGRAAADAGQKQRLPAAQPGSRGNTRAAIAKQVKATRRRPNLLNETDTHSTKESKNKYKR